MRNIRPYRGQWPVIGKNVYIDPAAVVIGDVEIGDDSSIWPGAVVRGDVAPIRIGARTNVQDGAILHVTHQGRYSPAGGPLRIGDEVTIAHGAILHACTLEDACMIGMRAAVIDGVRVCRHAMVGAGALVTPGKSVGTGELWLGNPAKFARALTAEQIEMIDYLAGHYVRVKNEYLAPE